MIKQLILLKEIFEEKNFTSPDDFISYKNTRSIIEFICDKGHLCKTEAKYFLYQNVGCKKCQYEKRRNILNSEVKDREKKICNCCNEIKNISFFGRNKSNIDGIRNTCKLCRRKLESKCDKSKRKINSLNFCKNRPFRVLLSRSKFNHNKKGFIEKFELTEDYLREIYEKQKGKCFWSGIDISTDNIGLSELNSISVDRIDSNIGYIKGNIVLSSKFYNLGRGNMNSIEFYEFLVNNNLIHSEDILEKLSLL